MKEEEIFFNSGGLRIEGLLRLNNGDGCSVITHPHPSYGGDMYNNVVEAICEAYDEMSYTTLRFNFRGVGRSDGISNDGIGERNDVVSAIEYLYGLGKNNIDLAGYSFGAWVNILALTMIKHAKRLIMVSPPIDFLDFSSTGPSPKIELVICGTEDEFANAESVKKKTHLWNKNAVLKFIEGADHFYWGRTDEIKSVLNEFVNKE